MKGQVSRCKVGKHWNSESDHHISACFVGDWWRAGGRLDRAQDPSQAATAERESASSDKMCILNVRLAEDADVMCANGVNSQWKLRGDILIYK